MPLIFTCQEICIGVKTSIRASLLPLLNCLFRSLQSCIPHLLAVQGQADNSAKRHAYQRDI